MRNISVWAKKHKWTARFIIVISSLLLAGLGLFTGYLLSGLKISFPFFLLALFISGYVITALLYPGKDQKERLGSTAYYFRQKSCDFILATASFCMFIYLGNRPSENINGSKAQAAINMAVSFPKDSSARSYKSIKEFSASMKDEHGDKLKWKERKKLLKEQLKAIKKAGDISTGGKILLTILSVAAAIGLLALVGALACNLSCSGADGAAALVLIGGLGITVFLLILALRGIYGRKRKRLKEETETSARQ